MRIMLSAALAAALLTTTAGLAAAEDMLGSYVARISDNDHYNSNGEELDTAAQMVRQDRANFHQFGMADADDEEDAWFTTTAKRAAFEKLLNKSGAIDSKARKAIAGGEPLVQVDVWPSKVKVTILEE